MPSFSWNEIRHRAKVEECAQGVLYARPPHLDNGATLADRYDPHYMPAPLLKAHQNLDRAVDRRGARDRFPSFPGDARIVIRLTLDRNPSVLVPEGRHIVAQARAQRALGYRRPA